MASGFGKYLTRHLKTSGLGTQLALSKAIEMDYGQLNKIFTGKTQRPEIETLQKIAPAIKRPIEEVMREAGYPAPQTIRPEGLASTVVHSEAQRTTSAELTALAEIGRQVVALVQRTPLVIVPSDAIDHLADDDEEMVEWPVYDAFAADRLDTNHRQVQERIKLPKRLIETARRPLVILITGDCLMRRGIIRGDYVVVDAANTDPRNGQMVAFRFRGNESVKVFRRDGGTVHLEPTTDEYKPIIVQTGEESDLEIVGVVTAWWPAAPRE